MGQEAQYGNIYISDSSGSRLTTSLMHNAIDYDGNIDFVKIESLEGVYLANTYEEKKIPRATRSGMQKESSNQFQQLDQFKQTKISFDKGGIWHYITAPNVDSKGNTI